MRKIALTLMAFGIQSYFFKMSAYSEKLVAHIEANPGFILPETRKNEVSGLHPPGAAGYQRQPHHDHVGHSDAGRPEGEQTAQDLRLVRRADQLHLGARPRGGERYQKFWPEAIHLVGKDILRFHAVYWPTFLMALGLPLPKQVVAHGWLTDSNRKISKSLGNAIDPIELAKEVGVDGMRFFLFREFSFGQDGEYTKEVMYKRINSDLANDYGNSVSRVCSMILKYFGETPLERLETPSELAKELVDVVPGSAAMNMEAFHYERALESVWTLITQVNRDIDAKAPWALAKSAKPEDKETLRKALLEWHELLRIASVWLLPFIPASAQRAQETLGTWKDGISLADADWGKGPWHVQVKKPVPLFPRLEWKPPQP